MEVEEAAILLQKRFGPVLLVLGPLMLAIVVFAGIRDLGTPEELSLKQWAFGISYALGSFLLGVYLCRNHFGWFRRSK